MSDHSINSARGHAPQSNTFTICALSVKGPQLMLHSQQGKPARKAHKESLLQRLHNSPASSHSLHHKPGSGPLCPDDCQLTLLPFPSRAPEPPAALSQPLAASLADALPSPLAAEWRKAEAAGRQGWQSGERQVRQLEKWHG